VLLELLRHQLEELAGHAIGVGLEAVPAQAGDRDHLQRRPAERRVPLVAGHARAGEDAAPRLEAREVIAHAPRLLGGRSTHPERVEGRRELVAAAALRLEVVVEVEPRLRVPQVAVDRRAPGPRPLAPAPGRVGLAQQLLDLRGVLLHLVEERVETHRRVVDHVDVQRSEALGRVEARFAHRAVALVEERRQPVGLRVVVARRIVVRDLVGAVVLARPIVVRPALGVPLVALDLRGRAVALVVVAREAEVGQQVRLLGPEPVVGLDRRQRAEKPGPVLRPLVDPQHHPRQERRLRARQIVGAVGVQNRAVVLDLVEEVLHHVPRALELGVAQQPHLDEVAVPAVHLVEAASGDHVGAREVQQPVLAHGFPARGQHAQVDRREALGPQALAQLALDALLVLARREVHRKGPPWRQAQLRVAGRLRQIGGRACERGPTRFDVGAHRLHPLGPGPLPALGRCEQDERREGERQRAPHATALHAKRHDLWRVARLGETGQGLGQPARRLWGTLAAA
jgi:hypothetical protein